MSLATAGGDGLPRVRTVLLKGLSARGFVFYTNFGSRKGRQLAENPVASLLFRGWRWSVRSSSPAGRTVGDDEARALFPLPSAREPVGGVGLAARAMS